MEMERGCRKKMKMYHKKIKLHIPDIGKKSGWERQDIAFKDDKTEQHIIQCKYNKEEGIESERTNQQK